MDFEGLTRFRRRFWILLVFSSIAACGGSDESDELLEAIDIGTERVVSLQVVSEDDKTVFEASESWQFSVTAVREDGSTFDATERVAWSTGDGSIARVNNKGLLTAEPVSGAYTTDVIANWAHLNSFLTVTVSDAALLSIVAKAKNNPVDECLTTSLSAIGNYSDGTNRPLADVSWSVNDSLLASISDNSLITFSSGNIEVTAMRDNLDSVPLSVVISDSLNGIRFSNGNTLSARSGESLALQTLGSYSAGEADITVASVWSSADESLVKVSDSGILQALRTGDTSVTASCGGLLQTLIVSVVDVTDIIIVDPEDADMKGGESRQLELFKVFSDNSTGSEDIADDNDVVWDIELGDAIASISDTGELTLVDDISDYEDSFIRVFAEFEGFDDTLVIRLDKK